MSAAPVLYINGFPGTGKLTIARAIHNLLGEDQALLIDNHSLIDPVEARYARAHPQYLTERRKERERGFRLYVYNEAMRSKVIIFTGNEYIFLQRPRRVADSRTDCQSSSPKDKLVAMEFQDAAAQAGRLFVPINLFCDVNENARRICSEGRARSGTTKLLDPEVLVQLREKYEIFCFGVPEELCLDVTTMGAWEVAGILIEWLMELG